VAASTAGAIVDITLRAGTRHDAEAGGRICFAAFNAIAAEHNFPPDFPSEGAAVGLLSMLLRHPGFYSVVAEVDGRIVGSNFLDERSPIAGVGPITVDPALQNEGVGRLLMQHVLGRCEMRGAPGVRLLQASYHRRSLALYAKLGFEVRDLLACFDGTPQVGEVAGHEVRQAEGTDLAGANAVARRVHGFDRAAELSEAITRGTALVVQHDGRITGYSTDLAFFAHTVAESNEDMKALILAGRQFGGPGILVPTSNAELFGWCLSRGLHIVQLMTLMTIGLYNEPRGAYLPSVLY
jgi:predicted N-acetyltransferase YhbS